MELYFRIDSLLLEACKMSIGRHQNCEHFSRKTRPKYSTHGPLSLRIQCSRLAICNAKIRQTIRLNLHRLRKKKRHIISLCASHSASVFHSMGDFQSSLSLNSIFLAFEFNESVTPPHIRIRSLCHDANRIAYSYFKSRAPSCLRHSITHCVIRWILHEILFNNPI